MPRARAPRQPEADPRLREARDAVVDALAAFAPTRDEAFELMATTLAARLAGQPTTGVENALDATARGALDALHDGAVSLATGTALPHPAAALDELHAATRRRDEDWAEHYTPRLVAAWMVALALDGLRPTQDQNEWRKLRVLDPAVGGGRLLAAAALPLARRCSGEAHPPPDVVRTVIEEQLFGVDIAPDSVSVARAVLGEMGRAADGGTASQCHLERWDGLDLLATTAPAAPIGFPTTYDLIVGNPPYGYVREAKERAALRSRVPGYIGTVDLYRLFFEAALAHLAPGGRLCLLIPSTWLTLVHAASLRAKILGRFRLLEVARLDYRVFPRRTVDVAITLIENGAPDGRPVRLRTFDSPKALAAGQTREDILVAPEDVLADAGAQIPGRLGQRNSRGASLAKHIAHAFPRLDEQFRVICGLKPYQRGKGNPAQSGAEGRARAFETDGPHDESCRPLLTGRQVQPYAVHWRPDSWLRYGPWLAEPRPAEIFDAPFKVVGRQTGDRIIAGLDDARRVARDSTWIVLPQKEERPAAALPRVLWLLAVLNAPVATWLFRQGDPDEAGKSFAQVRVGSVRRLPVPPLEIFTDERERAWVIDTVARRTQIAQQLAAGPEGEGERARLEVAAAELDELLHGVVCDAYGLTETEAGRVRDAAP